MLNDEPFESELTRRLAAVQVLEPPPGFVAHAVRTFRRRRRRRRSRMLALAVPVLAAGGLVLGIPGHGPSGSSIRLAGYTFHWPTHVAVAASTKPRCLPVAAFRSPVVTTSNGAAPTVANLFSFPQVRSALSANGGCVVVALSKPFTATGNPPNPYALSTGARPLHLDRFQGWLSTSTGYGNAPLIQLTVAIPRRHGQVADLAVAEQGVTASTLLTVVTSALSVSH